MQDPASDLSQAFGGTVHSLDEMIPAFQKFREEGGNMAEILRVVDLRQAAAFEQMLSNVDKIELLRNKMKEANGESARMAAVIGDTLQGAFLKFTSAMQGLGKIADPTGQVSRNLEYVSQTIDLMNMLKVKTKGNTTDEIDELLEGMLSELGLNYVDEKARTENKVEEETKKSDDK